LKKHP